MDEKTRAGEEVDASALSAAAGIVWSQAFGPGCRPARIRTPAGNRFDLPYGKPEWFDVEGHGRDVDGNCPCGSVEGSEHVRRNVPPETPETSPKVGDRVKVTIEGEVAAAGQDAFRVGGIWVYPSSDKVTSVKVVDPDWLPGDVAVCRHDYAYLRTADALWIDEDGIKLAAPCEEPPMTLLVRGGRAV